MPYQPYFSTQGSVVQPKARLRVLKHAAQKLVFERGVELNLERIAQLADVPAAQARELFGDDAGLVAQLSDYKDELLHATMRREIGGLPADASAVEKLRAALMAYFLFSVQQRDYFLTMLAFEVDHGEQTTDTSLDGLMSRPFLRTITGFVRQVADDAGTDISDSLCFTIATTLLGAAHGYAHLCAYANSRHLVDSAKKQTMASILDTLLTGVRPFFEGKKLCSCAPETPAEPAAQPPLPVEELGRDTPSDRYFLLLRRGVQTACDTSLDNTTLVAQAELVGLSAHEANHMFDGDHGFLRAIEGYLDGQLSGAISHQLRQLSDAPSPFSTLKASVFGQLDWSLTDPVGVVALSQVTSGSVVPVSRAFVKETDSVPTAFRTSLNAVNDAADASGIRLTDWDHYVWAFTVWSTFHGVIHTCSVGAGAAMQRDIKFALVGSVMDIVIAAMSDTFELGKN